MGSGRRFQHHLLQGGSSTAHADDEETLISPPNGLSPSSRAAPSSQQPTQPAQPVPPLQLTPRQDIRDNRILIKPAGNDSFIPHEAPVRKMWKVVTGNFTQPYSSYEQVPEDVRQLWFNEWSCYFKWDSKYDARIRNNYERKIARRITDNLSTEHAKANKDESYVPRGIEENIWLQLRRRYKAPAVQRKVAIQKANRAKGQSSHSGGSRSHLVHKRAMTQDLGEEPDAETLFVALHKKKDGTMLNNKCAVILQQYRTLMAERCAQAELSSAPLPYSYDIWVEVVGGIKKKAIFGLGAAAYDYMERQHRLVQPTQPEEPTLSDLVQTMQAQLEELRAENIEALQRAERTEVERRRVEEQFLSFQSELQEMRTMLQNADEQVPRGLIIEKLGQLMQKFVPRQP